MSISYRIIPRIYRYSPNFALNTGDDTVFAVMREKAAELQQNGGGITIQYEKNNCLSPQAVCVTPIYENEITEYHNHDYYEINYVFSGKLYQYVNDECFIMQPGHLLLMHPNVFHSPYVADGAKAINVLIHSRFVERLISEYTKENQLTRMVQKQGFILLDTSANAEIGAQFDKLRGYSYAFFAADSPMIPYLETQVRLMLMQLVVDENKAELIRVVHGIANHREDTPRQIIQYVMANFATVTMAELCKRFGYSRMQIYRIFKNCTGYNFSNSIGELRCSRIRYLLTRTDMSINDICREVGIEKPYIFEFFKIRTGVTMLEYRKMLKGENSQIL